MKPRIIVWWSSGRDAAKVGWLMYELTCPSCKKTTSSLFVRVGASVACASCQHRYVIESIHIQRDEPAEPQSKTVSVNADTPQVQAPSPTTNVDEEGAGLSGLTEVMKHEGAPPPPKAPSTSAPLAQAQPASPAAPPEPVPSSGLGKALARQRRRRRRSRSSQMMLLLLICVVLVLGILGIIIVLNRPPTSNPQPQPQQPTELNRDAEVPSIFDEPPDGPM